MPMYTYNCPDCNHTIDLYQSIKEGDTYKETIKECPNCASANWQRIIGKTSFKLEGYGWFRDGY